MKSRNLVNHILGWVGAIALSFLFKDYPIEINPPHFNPPNFNSPPFNIPPPHNHTPLLGLHFGQILLWIILISYFYCNRSFLIPKLLFKKKTFQYFSVSILIFLVVVYLPFIISFIKNNGLEHGRPPIRKVHFLTSIIYFGFTFICSTGVPLIKRWIKSENESIDIKNQHLQTELALLKSQVSPHFLFNTLNNIYSLAIRKDDLAAESILKLSQMLRYLLEEGQQEKISIGKEFLNIQDFVDLNKLRTTENVSISISSNIEHPELSITPLLFIPIIENAFKYGISTRINSVIDFSLVNIGNSIEFISINTIAVESVGNNISTGIGLGNVRKRLSLLYPNAHTLEVINDGKNFIVTIKIQNL